MSEYKFTVFGSPIAHSRSPQIHQCFARQGGLTIDYTRSLTSASDFPEAFRQFAASGGVGANVTLPLKEIALRYVESVSERAQAAGALNTLIKTEQGWYGDNTDGAGLLLDLQRLDVDLAEAKVLLVGAGGATRGIIQPLVEAKVAELVIANRTESKAQVIVSEWRQRLGNSGPKLASYGLADDQLNRPWDLIINATSAGLGGERPMLSAQILEAQPFCYDMVYGAKPTAFLAWAQGHQCAVADGLGMLVGQAAESFYLWTGYRPELADALAKLR